MKILWSCPDIISDFREEFRLTKRTAFMGWITGLLHQLEQYDELEIGCCFPVLDKTLFKDGVFNSHKYYSYHCEHKISPYFVKHDRKTVERFEEIINGFKPDVIHIWGTGEPTGSAMIEACENLSVLDKVVISIHGAAAPYAYYYYADIPQYYETLKISNFPTIEEEKSKLINLIALENEQYNKVIHVMGRTDWDKAVAIQANPHVKYHFCPEVLRDKFYENIGKWNIEKCELHSIFMSQGTYPLKGLHFLLKAMPEILKRYPDTHIYVAGDNPIAEIKGNIRPYGVYIKDLMSTLGLTDKVTFLGILDEESMPEQFLKANVFVSASSTEDSPNSVCEAMLIGTPTVASLVGGVGNLITDKASGLLYQYNSPHMLAHYVCEIFGNDDLAAKLSENAVESMKKIVDRKINSDITALIYKKISGK